MVFEKNQLVELTIEDMGSDGEGIGKVEGFTFFIKDALIGDVVTAKVTKVKKNYGFARLEEIITPSPSRCTPECSFHRQCGGCQIQAMSYEKQLEYKASKVRGNLIRIGGFDAESIDAVMEPIVGMENPYHYRNKAQYPIGVKEDEKGQIVPIAGFYAGRTHHIIANTDCLLGCSENKDILELILGYMKEGRVTAYNEETGKGLVRHVLIRKGFSSGELMVCLVINGKKLPEEEKLIQVLSAYPNMTSVSISVNAENTNVIMGKSIRTLWGSERIKDTIHMRSGDDFSIKEKGVDFLISPLSFYQVNPVQTEKLYSLALEYASLTGNETVWDLYCGIGTISLFLAQKAKQVFGVEIIPQAIEDAKENAKINDIQNATFMVGKAEEVLPQFYQKEKAEGRKGRADVIVVDPPRKGCDPICLETMLQMQPDRIVYVSCDSATLARDLKILCDGGYELKKVRPVDQFPHTMHVETVVLLSQQKPDTHIKVGIDLDDLDLTSAEAKATYEELKQYILDKHGMKVSNLYISQIKRKYGLEVGKNYNVSKTEDAKVPQCTPEKEAAIMDALKHFAMI